MKTEYMVQEKGIHCWLGLNRGRPFKTKEEAKEYLTQYQLKHANATLRIVMSEWNDEKQVSLKEVQ